MFYKLYSAFYMTLEDEILYLNSFLIYKNYREKLGLFTKFVFT